MSVALSIGVWVQILDTNDMMAVGKVLGSLWAHLDAQGVLPPQRLQILLTASIIHIEWFTKLFHISYRSKSCASEIRKFLTEPSMFSVLIPLL